VSRIGKQPVVLPQKVDVTIDGTSVKVKGPLGELSRTFVGVEITQSGSELVVKPVDDSRINRAMWGLARALVQNMVTGVSTGFTRVLEIHGVGYRAETAGSVLNLTLGHSHPINFELPTGVTAKVDKNTIVTLQCIDKEMLGQTAAKVRGFRPPEPYKGKGVRYQGEQIRRKAGKAAKK
jgi:large subunit ribosomal protein L6